MKAQVLSRHLQPVFIVRCARNGSVPAQLTQKNQFPDVWSGTESRSRSLFTKPFPGSPRLRLGPDVPYFYSFVARSGLKGRTIRKVMGGGGGDGGFSACMIIFFSPTGCAGIFFAGETFLQEFFLRQILLCMLFTN